MAGVPSTLTDVGKASRTSLNYNLPVLFKESVSLATLGRQYKLIRHWNGCSIFVNRTSLVTVARCQFGCHDIT